MTDSTERTSLATGMPNGIVHWRPSAIRPQWYHPLLERTDPLVKPLSATELQTFAYDYFLRFLPFFRGQAEGSISPGTMIEFTRRMKQKLGLAFLFEHKIRLNELYFARDPALLPYTLFHEMIHLWLYDCYLDPGHTRRFYLKMEEFTATGLPIDNTVHIHSRLVPESKYVYQCPKCTNRWYLREPLSPRTYCGHCFDKLGAEHLPVRINRPTPRQEQIVPGRVAGA